MVFWLSVSRVDSHVTAAEFAFDWSPALAPLDPDTSIESLVVLLLTNDVDPTWAEVRKRADRSIESTNDWTVWCEKSFSDARRQIAPGYFHPSAPVLWQRLPLGLPPILTGGKPTADVSRAMVVVTDGDYRVLEFMVGVPSTDELTRLIEDAEETRRWMHQHHASPRELSVAMVDRNQARVGRLWKTEMQQQLVALGESPPEQTLDPIERNKAFTDEIRVRLRPIGRQLQIAYLKEAQLRFGLTNQTDLRRLSILEQHGDTRMPWAWCLSPFLAGVDVRECYRQLAEMVWGQRAIAATRLRSLQANEGRNENADAVQPLAGETLASWIEHQGDRSPFALKLTAVFMKDNNDRAVVASVAERHGLGWGDLDETLSQSPVLEVSALELAIWLYRNGRRPIDLSRPSDARVLFFRSRNDHAHLIRDGDPPGRSITMIRQTQR